MFYVLSLQELFEKLLSINYGEVFKDNKSYSIAVE